MTDKSGRKRDRAIKTERLLRRLAVQDAISRAGRDGLVLGLAAGGLTAAFLTAVIVSDVTRGAPEAPVEQPAEALRDITVAPQTKSPVRPAPVTVRAQAACRPGDIRFDYSTNNGIYVVGAGDQAFGIKFSKADDEAIHVYTDHPTVHSMARVKNARYGNQMTMSDYDRSSRAYTIEEGETFLMRNNQGYYLQAQISAIEDDTRNNAPVDRVCFRYQINPEVGNGTFTAMVPTGPRQLSR